MPARAAERGRAAAAAARGPGALALAAVVDSALALAFTIAFARVLGAEGYGSLAALVSIFLIVSIAGSALQVAVARRIGAGGARDVDFGASAAGWTRALVLAALVLLAIGALAREPLGELVGVDERWAVALVLPAAALDLALAVQRGVLLGIRAYGVVALSIVAAPAGWLVFGGLFALLGLEVAGVIAGIALAELVNVVVLAVVVRRRTSTQPRGAVVLRLAALARGAWGPLLGLALFAALHNLDVVVVRRAVEDDDVASSYAAAAIASKAILWVAIGVGLYLVPEAARRHAAAHRSTALLGQAIAVVLLVAVPVVVLYALAGEPLLSFVFGDELALGSDALPLLAGAMALLACGYLAVQLLLAHNRHGFLVVLGVAAVAEPVVVAVAAPDLVAVAGGLAVLAGVASGALLALAVRSARRPAPASGPG